MDGSCIRGAVDRGGSVTLQAIVAEKSSAVAFTVLVVRTRRVPRAPENRLLRRCFRLLCEDERGEGTMR